METIFKNEVEFWFQENDEVMGDDAASTALAAVVGQLRGLKPFPAAARELITCINDENHDRQQVVTILEADPGLASKALRTVNSAAYGLRRECASVKHATMLLGSKQIAEIATGFMVMDEFSDLDAVGQEIRSHCFLVASLCRRIAMRHPSLRGVDVFTCGLMHDLGKLLQLQVDDGSYCDLLGQEAAESDSLCERERALFGYDHAILGAHVMVGWQLPDPLPQVVAMHHQPTRAYHEGGVVASVVAAVHLADAITIEAGGDVDSPRERLERLAGSEAAQYLELDVSAFERMWPDLSWIVEEAGTHG